jgi:DNA-binding transcriptional MerR regulator
MAKKFQIPDKKYFSIGEVAELCELKTHTLRFWEKEFKNLNPITRKGNRRYYQRQDILLVMKIRSLLYNQGLTVSGAKMNLVSKGKDNSETVLGSFLHQKQLNLGYKVKI